MMKKIVLIAGLMGVYFGARVALAANALEVKGPAGKCTDVWWDGEYHAKNRCERKVKVHLGPWFALVNPGQTHDFGAVKSFFGETSSEYAD